MKEYNLCSPYLFFSFHIRVLKNSKKTYNTHINVCIKLQIIKRVIFLQEEEICRIELFWNNMNKIIQINNGLIESYLDDRVYIPYN